MRENHAVNQELRLASIFIADLESALPQLIQFYTPVGTILLEIAEQLVSTSRHWSPAAAVTMLGDIATGKIQSGGVGGHSLLIHRPNCASAVPVTPAKPYPSQPAWLPINRPINAINNL
ncbi:hypothetical protein C5612_26975 [Pseudomonas frederiksbergensis]|uniref:Uncharacterized protein n=1 Tax=Pseudomonas frederiksbergensis TaxID=104087 RepID=A0A2S8H8N1_9PSED|nr:hypothetical protein C5612_26975 [Pseudomonas frederiksbergensis]